MAQQLANILAPLTNRQRIYVECLLKGMSKRAAATAAGASDPKKYLVEADQSEAVQIALRDARKTFAEEVDFTRREAYDMLMAAFRNAETAGEQVQAARELIKLFGIQAPEKVEHHHTHDGQIEFTRLPDNELLELADLDGGYLIEGEYEEVTDDTDDDADQHEESTV